MDNVLFANRLKQLRKERGITQKQLADELKISLSSVIHYENAHRSPISGVITLMQQYFDVNKEYLLGETDDRQSSWKWDDPEFVQAIRDNLSTLFDGVEQAVREVSDEEQTLVFDVLVELRSVLKSKNSAQRLESLRLFHDMAPAVLHWPERNCSDDEGQK